MDSVSPDQIRAARSFLGWTQKQLEEASGVGLSTIGDFEDKKSSPRRDTLEKLYKTFEKNGVEFTPDGGIKPRKNRHRIIDGPDSCEKLFNDILETIEQEGGEVLAFLESYRMLTCSRGSARHSIFDRLSLVHQIAPVRCIVSEPLKSASPLPPFKLRTAPKEARPGNFYFFIYGDKYAMILENQRMETDFVVIRGGVTAEEVRNDFMSVWDR